MTPPSPTLAPASQTAPPPSGPPKVPAAGPLPASTSGGLSSEEAKRRLQANGPNEVPEEPPHVLLDFLRRFWGPVAWMLEIAFLIEVALDKVPEAVIIFSLLVFNAVLAQIQERRAQDALNLLRHRLRVTARVLRDGTWTTVPARELVTGDRVHLRMGDIVPSDCLLTDGEVEVDQSTITGESAAVTRLPGSTLYSSSVVRRGEASADVTATGTKSFYGKTAELVRSARSVSHLETLLLGVIRYLVTMDVVMALAVVAVALFRVPSLTGLENILPFVLILLIASVPVAMPATFTIANAVESRRLVTEGVLVTGLTAVQESAELDLLCVDKTGTMTEGRETLGDLLPSTAGGEVRLLQLASAACDESTQDTIDLAILNGAKARAIAPLARSKFLPFDPAKKRSEAWVSEGGASLHVLLGSPQVVAGLCENPPADLTSSVEKLSGTGARVVAIAAGPEGHLRMEGLLALADPPRPDAAELVRTLTAMGIHVMMLTGDTPMTARAVARKVGLGDHFGERADLGKDPSTFDGYAGIYPEDKYALVKGLQAQGHIVGMTGDGVNDAPALKQAEVGIAVASATDVARASAKLVLTRPGLKDIVSAVQSGRRVYSRMLTWTLGKLSKNIEQVMLLSVGFIATGIFVTTPLLILLMIFANDFVTMSVGSDNARISPAPDRWDMREVIAVAGMIGAAWVSLSFVLLWWALDVAHLSVPMIQTFFFVYLVFGSQGTILLARERGRAWESRPATPLLVAMAADIVVVSLLGITGTLMTAIPATLVVSVLAVVAGYSLVVDQVKVAFLRWTGAFGPNSKFERHLGAALSRKG